MERFNFDNFRQRLLSKSYFSVSELRRRETIFAKKLRGPGFNLSRSLFCTAAEMCEGANFAHGSQCRAAYAPTQKTWRHSRELKFFSFSREALFNEQFGFKSMHLGENFAKMLTKHAWMFRQLWSYRLICDFFYFWVRELRSTFAKRFLPFRSKCCAVSFFCSSDEAMHSNFQCSTLFLFSINMLLHLWEKVNNWSLPVLR